MSLMQTYIELHKQGWLPIFVRDNFDAVFLADVCVQAGARVVEITCRRPHVSDDIRRIRAAHPDLRILVGSTIDSDVMVEFSKHKKRPIPRLAQLAALDVQGFISLLPFSQETILRYRGTHLLIPGVETSGQAYRAITSGAHFAKIHAASLFGGASYVRSFTSAPTFGLLPLFVTGGISQEKIQKTLKAGAALLGGGWDLMLSHDYQQLQLNPSPQALLTTLSAFLKTFQKARKAITPKLFGLLSAPSNDYLAAVDHYHPFKDHWNPSDD